jgi:DNA adenine methylase
MKPFVKWAGGKRQILSKIVHFIDVAKPRASSPDDKDDAPSKDYTYIEPFLGGGAVFFSLHPNKAIINDLNDDLMNVYSVLKSNDYTQLIDRLKQYETEYTYKIKKPDDEGAENYYYRVRGLDRDSNWLANSTPVERAARMVFLNRTCYNGLYRVNNKGYFNTPIGRYKNPLICDEENLTEIHNYLANKENSINITSTSYEEAIRKAKSGDLIYADPPYDYEDDDGFTKYQIAGFTFDDFENLKKECDVAISRGAVVIISNNSTEKVNNLFSQDSKYKVFYLFESLDTLRSINCNGDERKTGKEVIILGMQNILPQANNMDSIIKLAMLCDNEALKDKKRLLEIIGAKSERQVIYYLQALQYLGYINQTPKYSDRICSIHDDEKAVKKDIFNQLINDDLFKPIYQDALINRSKISNERICEAIESKKLELADSTIKRRASTIKTWVEWMLQQKKSNE